MTAAKIECPICRALIERPEIVGESVRCSECSQWFKPSPNDLAELIVHRSPIPPAVAGVQPANQSTGRTDKVRRTAQNFVTISVACWVIAIFIWVCGIIGTVSSGDGLAGSLDWFLPGASLLGLGLWLYLIGQIVHIRANTEK